MLKKQLYWIGVLALLVFASCGDDDKVGFVDKVNLLDFEFPQGDNSWDKEIEQIAKDWGMYIIYKDVDSTHLNRRWTTPLYNEPIYVCSTPSDEEIQVYLNVVKEWLLGSLDKNKESDRKQLPYYLYLVNDLNDGNPRSQTYQNRHIQIKKDGFDYWSLSFTSEELADELAPETIHTVACAFSYPGIKARFESGEYKVAPGFSSMTDYQTEIGRRYYSFEQWKADNPYMPESFYDRNIGVEMCDKDLYNVYLNRGLARQMGEDFQEVNQIGYTNTYGAPTWMPWIVTYNADYDYEIDVNPGPVAESTDERVLLDFLNMIRTAMAYPEERVREIYPLGVGEDYEQAGYQTINDKYDLVVDYMMTAYGVDLQKYGDILNP